MNLHLDFLDHGRGKSLPGHFDASCYLVLHTASLSCDLSLVFAAFFSPSNSGLLSGVEIVLGITIVLYLIS